MRACVRVCVCVHVHMCECVCVCVCVFYTCIVFCIYGGIVNVCTIVLVTMFNSHTHLKDNLIFLINHESKAFKSGNCEYPHATQSILRTSTMMEHKMSYGVE